MGGGCIQTATEAHLKHQQVDGFAMEMHQSRCQELFKWRELECLEDRGQLVQQLAQIR